MQADLNDVMLFAFAADPEEVRVPRPLVLDLLRGRAIVTVASVRLEHVRPAGLPKWTGIRYHHVAYRTLVKGGLHFPITFADRRHMCVAGNLLSEFKYNIAAIRADATRLRMRYPGHNVDARPGGPPRLGPLFRGVDEARAWVGPRTAALTVHDDVVHAVRVSRSGWPIEAVGCRARLEALGISQIAFRVREAVSYTWSGEPLHDAGKLVNRVN